MHFMLTYLCSLKSSPTNGEIGHQHDGSMAQNQSGGPWCQLLGTARHSVVLNGTYVLPKRQEDKGLVVKNKKMRNHITRITVILGHGYKTCCVRTSPIWRLWGKRGARTRDNLNAAGRCPSQGVDDFLSLGLR
jgi:hypothetical protein